MSRRNFRPSRTATAVAAADTRPKAVRRDGLKEISLESWRDWESITSELKEYFYQHYGALGNIFPDPLKLTATQNYRADIVVPDNSFPAASLEEAADPAGVQRARCIAAWAVAGKLNSQYLSDRAPVIGHYDHLLLIHSIPFWRWTHSSLQFLKTTH